MATETMHTVTAEPAKASTHPELLVSAVLHLMSHYTAGGAGAEGCTKLASVIERHLKALASLPDLAPVLRATCEQLAGQWAEVVENTMQASGKSNLIRRLISGNRIG